MKFKKGNSGNPNGRNKGSENERTKLMKTVKQTIFEAFNELQSDPVANIVTWAKANPAAFYLIASKLIPTEIQATTKKVGMDAEEEIYVD